ncbi:MAG TPA: type II toxin-antitoxin system VapC family toxin [Chloroflexota bacterium]|nr:type II toxin-antitoxin system VapC family toxin [Chloroflexota bacterium]
MRAVLDSWAVLAYLQDEPAADRVSRYLEQGECVLNVVNCTEVLSLLTRRRGHEVAGRFLHDVTHPRSPIRLIVAGPRLANRAAEVKAGGGMSLADAYAAATTLLLPQGILLTGDPELLAGSSRWGYQLEWLGAGER